MNYTKEDLRSMASDLCGIDSDSEGVAAIERVMDFLNELADQKEEMSNERV
jgi:hypothetical protein